jgi:hypothetical protein
MEPSPENRFQLLAEELSVTTDGGMQGIRLLIQDNQVAFEFGEGVRDIILTVRRNPDQTEQPTRCYSWWAEGTGGEWVVGCQERGCEGSCYVRMVWYDDAAVWVSCRCSI